MLLALDIGNTEVTVGLFRADTLVGHWRLTTASERTPDEWAIALEAFLARAGHSPAEIRGACVASVVPTVTQAMVDAVRSAITTRVGVLEPSTPLPLTLAVDEPLAVGADRIANVLGVLDRYPGDSIVIDFGTATTFDCVTADRQFFGGSIMPGIRTSADQLVRKAAKLVATELVPPARAIGRRTDENIQGGVLFGTADAVDGMVLRMRSEWPAGRVPRTVATGGLAAMIARLARHIDVVDPDLTLHGLRVAAASLEL